MKTLKGIISLQNIVFFCCLMIITGLFSIKFFRALSSIGIICLFVTAIAYGVTSNPGAHSGSPYTKLLRPALSYLLQQKGFLFLTIIFFLHLVTFFYTDSVNYGYFWEKITLNLTFLVLPLSFAILPAIKKRQYYLLLYFFFLLMALTSLGTFINYLFDFTFINESYLRSKVMPTPVNHVRYSLMVAFAIFVGVFLYSESKARSVGRYALCTMLITLFIFLHFLAVRSGLLAFYALAFSYTLFYIIKKKANCFIILFILLSSPIISYFAIPTFQNKFQNTVTDLAKIENKSTISDYSVSSRIVSYKAAFELIKKKPLTGTGIGNIKREMAKIYIAKFPYIKKHRRLMPHNQYLRYLVGFGIIGLSIFLFSFYYPLIYQYNYKNLILLTHYLIISISFLFEGTLNTQLGLNFTLIFILVPLSNLKEGER
ncbi:MAG: O-antigen ligase family protein [Cytophagales bacterium]|nr:O-antigen ligase family protein [Cytophagales bacterium]